VLKFRLNPLTAKKINRFRQIRRGYWSFLILMGLITFSLFGELFINSKALMVSYNGEWSFPTYSSIKLGKDFGLTGEMKDVPVNYRTLKAHFKETGEDNWVIMPPIPYNPYENNPYEGVYKPAPPDLASRHLLGTDTTGRDILARLFYGFRIAIFFAFAFLLLTYTVGITIGCMMGFFGGIFDLIVQRIIEIWSNVPFLYMVIIIFSIIPSTFSTTIRIVVLLFILVMFSWMGMTYYMRTASYKEKARDYVHAAEIMGASTMRLIFSHILPNSLSTIVTFMPFTIVGAITSITALDFLGFGLPAPTPSMGELLKQGTQTLTTAPWIVISAFASLIFILTLVTFVGEAVREAFDPKKYTIYQ